MSHEILGAYFNRDFLMWLGVFRTADKTLRYTHFDKKEQENAGLCKTIWGDNRYQSEFDVFCSNKKVVRIWWREMNMSNVLSHIYHSFRRDRPKSGVVNRIVNLTL